MTAIKKSNKVLSILFAIIMIFSCTASPISAYAATKPKATSISSISATAGGFKVKYKKVSGVSGYQIQYATKSDFSNKKSVKVTKYSTTSKTVSGLNCKQKYYVRVRTYKTSKNKTSYSSWSSKKSITTKMKSTSISKLTPKSTSITVAWKKAVGVTGYQIQYAAKSDFSNKKTIKITKPSTTSKTITSLKSSTKYYFRIRTYKTKNGSTYYSSWSSEMNATTAGTSATTETPPTTTVHTHNWVAITKTEPIYETQTTYEWEEHAFCNGCHIDCTVECDKYNISVGLFQMKHYRGYDPNIPACPKTYSDANGYYYYDYVQVPTGTEQVKVGEKTVTTGYKCSSCGATKST